MWVLAGEDWVDNPTANSDPKVVGWHTGDEPEMFGSAGFSWSDYQAEVDALRAKNDGRFIQTNFGNGVLNTAWWPDYQSDPIAGRSRSGWSTTTLSSVDKYAYTSPHIHSYLFPDVADRWPDGANARSSAAYWWMAREMGSYFQNPAGSGRCGCS